MADGNQINFLSQKMAQLIRENISTPVQYPSLLQTPVLRKKDLFYSIRRAKLLSSPTWNEKNKSWESDADLVSYQQNQQQQSPQTQSIKVTFEQKTEPQCGESDIIFVAYCGGENRIWVALVPDPIPRIARVLTSYPFAPNRWNYSLQLVSLMECRSHNYSPILDYESTPDGINLCEIENLETGLMGNGINLNGFAPSGTTNHYLAPVPFGTLVFAFGFNYWGSGEERKVYAFQFSNQLAHPFSSHLCIETQKDLEGPSHSGSNPDENHLTMSINGCEQKVYCPLLRDGEKILSGTEVIISQNIKTGFWEIIEAQCPPTPAVSGDDSEENDNSGQSENPEGGE